MTRPLSVLLVDDDDLVRETLSAYLEDDEMDIVGVASAEAAIERVAGGEVFDVAIIDLRLPGLDGNDAIRALAACAPSLHFLVHTGSVDYRPPADLVALGIDDDRVFVKPVLDLAVLADALRRVAGR